MMNVGGLGSRLLGGGSHNRKAAENPWRRRRQSLAVYASKHSRRRGTDNVLLMTGAPAVTCLRPYKPSAMVVRPEYGWV